VLTRNTLAILLPGQPRMFVHRKECTGVLPGSWNLVLRNERHLPLGSVSSKPYLKDLVSDVCKAWWPSFYGTPLWTGLLDRKRLGSLDLRVDFRGKPDGREPLLVYTAGRPHRIWQIVDLAACPILAAVFVLLICQNWNETTLFFFPEFALAWQILSVTASAVGLVASCAAMAYIARQVFFRKSSRRAFVISGRTLAVIEAADARTVFLHAADLEDFNPSIGQLFFRDGSKVIAAPYRYGDPYNGLLQTLFSLWRPGRVVVLVQAQFIIMGGNTLIGNLIAWFCISSLLGAVPLLQWIMLVFLWLDFRKRASECIDVSPSNTAVPSIPPVNEPPILR
jgi:hypothetical protein